MSLFTLKPLVQEIIVDQNKQKNDIIYKELSDGETHEIIYYNNGLAEARNIVNGEIEKEKVYLNTSGIDYVRRQLGLPNEKDAWDKIIKEQRRKEYIID